MVAAFFHALLVVNLLGLVKEAVLLLQCPQASLGVAVYLDAPILK